MIQEKLIGPALLIFLFNRTQKILIGLLNDLIVEDIFIISITKFKSAKISLYIMLVKVNDNKTLAGFSLVLVRHNYLGSISIHCCHSGFCEALHYSLDRLLHNV